MQYPLFACVSFIVAVVCQSTYAVAQAPEVRVREEGKVRAPDNYLPLRSVATGKIFVRRELKEQYDEAKKRYEALRLERYRSADVLDADGNVAEESFAEARKEFLDLQTQVDAKGVVVEPFEVYRRRETKTFELSEAASIVITSDDVKLRGWDGDNIKCVIEKAILATKPPSDSEFDAIKIKHAVRQADDWVGIPDDVRNQEQADFVKSADGKNSTSSELSFRNELLKSIRDHYAIYLPLQGKLVNTLQVIGLTGQEGNVHQTGQIDSDGRKTLGSYWRRSAKVTIYLPKCKFVAIRGCMVAVDIKSLDSNLILTTDGSHDVSYGSDFRLSDIQGNVSIRQVPMRVVNEVVGNVEILQTDDSGNTYTRHSGGMRTTSSPPPDPTTISDIAGDLKAHFVRADLSLEKIDGQIDVFNEYGNTRVSIDNPLKKSSHRIVTHSGAVRLKGMPVPKEYPDINVHDLAGVPVHAFSQTGSVKVRSLRQRLESKSYKSEGRNWQGFQSPTKGFAFGAIGRPVAAWRNVERKHGLDLISSAGTVVIESREK